MTSSYVHSPGEEELKMLMCLLLLFVFHACIIITFGVKYP